MARGCQELGTSFVRPRIPFHSKHLLIFNLVASPFMNRMSISSEVVINGMRATEGLSFKKTRTSLVPQPSGMPVNLDHKRCSTILSHGYGTRTVWPQHQSKGVRNDSATNLARAFKKSFISEISLSTSSINWMIKSTNLCLSISSVWVFVIKKLMS